MVSAPPKPPQHKVEWNLPVRLPTPAADLFRNHWCRDDYETKGGDYCLIGGLWAVYGPSETLRFEQWFSGRIGVQSPEGWNDNHTQAEVVALVEKWELEGCP